MKRKAKTIGIIELSQKYSTDDEARKYFEELRWGKEPVCIRCGCFEKITKQKKHPGRYWCGDCRSYFTAFTDTPFEYGKVSPRLWILAAYILMTARKGVSSYQLSKELSVSQPTAWYMLHRLRLAAKQKMEALKGEVEVDETYLGGIEKNRHKNKKQKPGGGAGGKTAIIGMRERTGKVKAMVIEDGKGDTLKKFVRENIIPGSTLYTDENRGYVHLGDKYGGEYKHKRVKHSAKEFVNEMAHTNGIESVWAVLKRGFNGVYHNWSKKHCHAYVDEFTFRLNEGNCEIDTEDRLESLFNAMVGKKITFKKLIA